MKRIEIDSEGNRWFQFKYYLPIDYEAIIIEDHEGNRAVGIWKESKGFENVHDHPIGIPFKWSPIKVKDEVNEVGFYRIFYKNGTEILVSELYDTEPLFLKKTMGE